MTSSTDAVLHSGKKRRRDGDAAPARPRKRARAHGRREQKNAEKIIDRDSNGHKAVTQGQQEGMATSTKKDGKKSKKKSGHAAEQSVEEHLTEAEKAAARKANMGEKKQIEMSAIKTEPRSDNTLSGATPTSTSENTKGKRAAHNIRRAEKKAKRKAAREKNKNGPSKQLVKREYDVGAVEEIRRTRSSQSDWMLSPPSAGRFLDYDPIFVRSGDGQDFIISANTREVQLLSLDTSLVVRTLAGPEGSSVLCYAIDALDSDLVNIAYDDGSVNLWDWTSDMPAKRAFQAKQTITAVASAATLDAKSSTLFYISTVGREQVVFQQDQRLYVTKQKLRSLQVLGNADFVVARGPSVLVLGMRKGGDKKLEEFVFVEMPLVNGSTCLDARLLPSPATNKKARNYGPGLRIAVGNENGQILLFEDVSSLFKQNGRASLPTPRILHWHREAVSSVKFSQDGNYLISGGKESVLVLWQLETGKKQYLPHLTSEIERIVVNPEGDRYAVQLGDNSIMVLSTSELKPVANFAGLQMSSPNANTQTLPAAVPAAVLHPKHPNQLLLTVPASQPKSSKDIATRPFLQSFDIRTSRHVTRQALTRNNVTDFNLGPERTPVVPPDVAHIAVSYDAQWLATIDEWMPPRSDLEHLASDEAGLEAEQAKRREVYLKIWNWDEEQTLWTLTTRMDSPHTRPNGHDVGAGKVLALASGPASTGFVTVGEDSSVKVWKPRTRTRHGVALKDEKDVEIVEWTCKRTVQLASDKGRADLPMDVAMPASTAKPCLAYSADGSVLAVSQTSHTTSDAPVVHFIDVSTGSIRSSKSGLAEDVIAAMGFLERYFIAVSGRAAYVWDLVNDTLMYKIKLASSSAREEESKGYQQLAVNDGDATFALVVERSRVEVYGPRQPKCLYKEEFGTEIETVLAGRGVRGYTFLFADATIRTLSPKTTSHSGHTDTRVDVPGDSSTQGEAETVEAVEVGDVDMAAEVLTSTSADQDQARKPVIEDEEDDRPVVRPEQLASIFDAGQSFAMPPVKDMFQAVVGLFGRKPFVKPQRVEGAM